MDEKRISIINNDLVIEGLLHESTGDSGVIICHPHPLMGGSMHNNVVEAIREAFAAEKYSTLRFNFRGVGRSTGVYDEGKGEQEDILAVCKYLHSIGVLKLSFAGYSFGSWVGTKIIEGDSNPFKSAILVSPPINYFAFDFTKLAHRISLIICGDEDPFCDSILLKERIKNTDTDLRIISHADHFYSGKENQLINILKLGLTSSPS